MKTDVVIIGGGPAGATASMFLAQENIHSLIIEKETFPRYHIGESMTGECGAILKELGLEEKMLKMAHPLKYGVTVYGFEGKNSWWIPVMGRDANGQLEENYTWQVRRSDFDLMMLNEAIARGVQVMHGQALVPLRNEMGRVCGVSVRTAGGEIMDIEAKMVLDCSGQSTFLANAGVTGPKYRGNYDRQMAVFSQVKGALRDDGDTAQAYKDNTLIFYKGKYHWGWFIPLDEEVVSVGVVAPAQHFKDQKLSKMDYLMKELQDLNPELTWRVQNIEFVEDAHAVVNYSYQVRDFAGPGYICVGDSHRFLDPIFSFGLYVAIKEGKLAAHAVAEYLQGKWEDEEKYFNDYMVYVEKGIDILEDALDAFWEQPLAFATFVHMRYRESMIDVFAGRIYGEEAQQMKSNKAFKAVLKRERNYNGDKLYSIPIGSRYNPGRAPVWEATEEKSLE